MSCNYRTEILLTRVGSAMAIAPKGALSSIVNQACSFLPGYFPSRCSRDWGVSPFLCQSWPDLSLTCSFNQRTRCLRLEESNAPVCAEGVPRLPCTLEEEEGTADGQELSWKDDDALRESSREISKQVEEPEKVWMRKQATTRALGLDTVQKASKNNGADALAIKNKDERNMNGGLASKKRWFPHENVFQVTDCNTVSSGEVVELLSPFMSEERKQRIERVVDNRTFSICTVVEGLSDVGNVSAICRTADAMGFQSIHVIANNHSLRYRENHRTSAGAEKWLDMEKWDDSKSCIETLKARGYRIAVTHIAEDTVSIHDMDWTIPTAIVLGNEHRGISQEAIALSDIRCSIPMAGMVESFNVSVAAAIILHHAAVDRISRVGYHGDLTEEERCTMLAVFYSRHRDDSKSILAELISRRLAVNS